MKKLIFSKATFIKSALTPETWPILKAISGKPLDEIAVIGRSNVGKSSLLNHLLRQKKLAKVSATPGKTQTLNFFNIDDEIALVDLPGYGYAQVSKELKRVWSGYLDAYLEKRPQIILLLLLLDIRRTPTKEDIAFMDWSVYHQRPVLVIFTKCDKVSANEKKANTEKALKMIPVTDYCHYSIKDPKARISLIQTIQRVLNGTD